MFQTSWLVMNLLIKSRLHAVDPYSTKHAHLKAITTETNNRTISGTSHSSAELLQLNSYLVSLRKGLKCNEHVPSD